MRYKEYNIKGCYESGVDDIVEDFYTPVLESAVSYDRIAGFFSSSSLAVSGRGLAGLIKKGGRMRLIASPRLDPSDKYVIDKFVSDPDLVSIDDLHIDFDDIKNDFFRDHVKALGWLLSKDLLEIRLAIVVNKDGTICTDDSAIQTGLFHQKVGILKDVNNDEISFSGSINETASAWLNNDEEFKVFKSWDNSSGYFYNDKNRFEEMWNGLRPNIKVFRLPAAVKEGFIKYSEDFRNEKISIERYRQYKKSCNRLDIPLFEFQKKAVETWRNNDFKLLYQMATGTGKTRTAIASIAHLLETKRPILCIVATPQNTLSLQWKKEVDAFRMPFDESVIIDGTKADWKEHLKSIVLKLSSGLSQRTIVFTTHKTASSEKFIDVINNYARKLEHIAFVGDEVHWLGAPQYRKSLLPNYTYRIGLSATPSRWFDDEGTKILLDYFGSKEYEFSIHEALTQINPLTGKHFLVNYFYNISKINLTDDETEKYRAVTKKISKLSGVKNKDPEIEKRYNQLLTKRADIIKNAENKYEQLRLILDEIEKERGVQNLIIFVSPQQIDRVEEILRERRIPYNRLTEDQGTRPKKQYNGVSEREFIIDNFKKGYNKVIVAIKCLDEGIDIPIANQGILMASSTNPREYIQRIGRIIRQSDNKTFSYLYDICVDRVSSEEDDALESRIRQKECERLEEIAENAINSVDALKVIMSLK